MSILVLGAGMAGLTCARHLVDAGADVQVIDKARGPSGRLASRRSDVGTFDHGAPLFRVRDADFQAAVDAWCDAGLVVPWSPRWSGDADLAEQSWYTAVPRMSALLRQVSDGIDCRWQCRATDLTRTASGWSLRCEDGTQLAADTVISTLPAPQAADLLRTADPALAERLAAIPFHGTWAGLLAFADDLPVDWDIHRGGDGPLHTVVREQTKPGREAGERVVVHGLDTWSDAHIDEDPATMLPLLRAELGKLVGHPLPGETFATAHRWRYAHASEPLGEACHARDGLVIAGDWCLGAGVGAAWASGRAAATAVLG